jgi:hypothetical protein
MVPWGLKPVRRAWIEVSVALGLVMRGKFEVVKTGMKVGMAVLARLGVEGVWALGFLLLMVMAVDLIDQVLQVITVISSVLTK